MITKLLDLDYKRICDFENNEMRENLEFFTNDHTDIEGGYLSLNGRINGKGIVQVRDPETMKILGQFKPGTPVTVFDILDDFGYAEIDIEGWHCVVMLECLTLDRDLVSASDSV